MTILTEAGKGRENPHRLTPLLFCLGRGCGWEMLRHELRGRETSTAVWSPPDTVPADQLSDFSSVIGSQASSDSLCNRWVQVVFGPYTCREGFLRSSLGSTRMCGTGRVLSLPLCRFLLSGKVRNE